MPEKIWESLTALSRVLHWFGRYEEAKLVCLAAEFFKAHNIHSLAALESQVDKPEASDDLRKERQEALDRLFSHVAPERVFDDPIDGTDFDFELMHAFDHLMRRWGTKQ